MLAPHELKNAEFTKALRGYSTTEVDEHIEFIIEKYTELYRLNDDLEKKLRLCQAQLDALKAEEESIKSTLINAQKAGNRIIAEANDRADVIMESAKNTCDRIIDELKEKIKAENEKLRNEQKAALDFKNMILNAYAEHISGLEKIVPDMEITNTDDNDCKIKAKEVLDKISLDLNGENELISGSFDPFTPENTENEVLANGEGSAEMPIPDSIEKDEAIKPDQSAFIEARDKLEDFLSEQTVVIGQGESIMDSIRKITEQNGNESDDDFISMLDQEKSDIDSQFNLVYDSKKNKKR